MKSIEFGYKLINMEECLMRFAYRLTVNQDDAKDLLQETFLKALKYCDKFADESSLRAWTYTIMKNTFINNYRRNIFQNIYNDQSKAAFFINQTVATCSDCPDSTYSVLEITQNIEQLKDKYRIPFEMYIKGYKYKEIADELCLNIGTVKSRIFHSRKQLRDKLNR